MKLLFENWRKYLEEAFADIGTGITSKVPIQASKGLEVIEKYGDRVWIFLDIETTGFSKRKETITEIAAIAIDPNDWTTEPEIKSTFSQKGKLSPYVRGREPESESAIEMRKVMAMTRYGEKDAPEGRYIPEKEMIEKFYNWVEQFGDVVLVIQNAKFDMGFISIRYLADPITGKATGKGSVGRELPRYPVIDTVPIFKNYLIPYLKTLAKAGDTEAEAFLGRSVGKRGKPASASLGALGKAYDIPIIGWHSAIEDIKILMSIFQKTVEKIRKMGDVDIRGEFPKIKPLTRSKRLKKIRAKQKRAAKKRKAEAGTS